MNNQMIVSLRNLFTTDLILSGQFSVFIIQIPDFLAFHNSPKFPFELFFGFFLNAFTIASLNS